MKTEKSIIVFFIALLVLTPLGYSQVVIDNSLLPKFLGLCVTIALGIGLFWKQIQLEKVKLNLLDLFLIGFLIIHTSSIFSSYLFPGAVYETLKVFLLVFLYFLTKLLLKTDKEKAFKSIAFCAAIATFLAIFTSIEELFEAFRMRVPLSSAVYKVSGLHGHKNMLSNWFLYLLPLTAIGLFIKSKTPKIIFQLAITIQVFMVAVLMTRAVYLAAIVSGITFLLIAKQRNNTVKNLLKTSAFTALSLASLAFFLEFFDAFPSLIELDPSKSSSTVERITVWSKTVSMIKEHFFLGVGAGEWKVWLPNYGLDGLRRTLDGTVVFSRAHNDYLQVWSELGVFGFAAFLGIIAIGIKSAFTQLFKDEKLNSFLLLGLSGVLIYATISFFDFPKERIEANIAFGIFLAIISSLSLMPNKSLPIKPILISGFSVLILLFASYFAWTRYENETNLRLAMTSKDKGNQVELKNKSLEAESKFYWADNNAIPICWYTGIAHFNLNEKVEAAAMFKKALESNPYNFNVTNNAGTAYFLEGNYEEAINLYLETLRINPYFDDCKLNLAACYVNTNRKAEANYWLDRVSVNSARLNELRSYAQ